MLQLKNISLHYGDHTLFNEIQLTVKSGEKLGLIGRNGAGKTTLLKIISGEVTPDGGQVEKASDYRIGFLPQHLRITDQTTPYEACLNAVPNIVLAEKRISELEVLIGSEGDVDKVMQYAEELADLHEQLSFLGAEKLEENVSRILKGLGFNEETMRQSIETLSGGWKMRVELAKLLLLSPDLLMLDEPTNHLDIHAIIWLEKFLKDYQGSVVLISHDRTFLDGITKRSVFIENEKLYDFPFPYSRAVTEKEQQEGITRQAFTNQQKIISDKEKLIDRFRAKASKAKFAKALQKEIDRMERVVEPDSQSKSLRLYFPEASREGAVVVKCDDLGKSYGEKEVFNHLDLSIDRSERIGFVGQNGMGKTTLIKLIIGEESSTNGRIQLGHNIELAYYPQNAAERLDGNMTVLETLEEVSPPEMRPRLRGILGAFLFENDDVDKKVKVLSGGERSRLALARLLLKPSNVLVLDEPTHHLDIPSKAVLKQALAQFKGTLLLVSHDRDFLNELVSHILEFREGKIKKFIGGIEEYLKAREMEHIRQVEMQSAQKAIQKSSQLAADTPQLSFEERRTLKREVQQVERSIHKLEEKKKALEKIMQDESFYQREDHSDILKEYQECLDQMVEREVEWEEKLLSLDDDN